jgi:hypothetical protein
LWCDFVSGRTNLYFLARWRSQAQRTWSSYTILRRLGQGHWEYQAIAEYHINVLLKRALISCQYTPCADIRVQAHPLGCDVLNMEDRTNEDEEDGQDGESFGSMGLSGVVSAKTAR